MKKKKPSARYFDGEKMETEESQAEERVEQPCMDPAEFEAKRSRMLKQVEMLKRGLPAGAENKEVQSPDQSLNDSGPYEEIPDDIGPPDRAPLGELPAFIPLESAEMEGEKEPGQGIDERLI